MLARFGAPAARRLWDTIKTEGLKQGGIGKIKSRLETETEKLNREVKEAIASLHAARPLRCNAPLCNSVARQVACARGISASLPQGTAKVTEIDLKQIDFTKYEPSKIDFDLRKIGLSQMVLMARSDYMGTNDVKNPSPRLGATLVSTMHVNEKGIQFLKECEEFIPYIYYDYMRKDKGGVPKRILSITPENQPMNHPEYGALTIGYGFTANSLPIQITNFLIPGYPLMTEEEADKHLREILTRRGQYEDRIKNYFKSSSRPVYLLQHEFDALVSIAYNNWSLSTGLVEYIKKGDYSQAAAEIGYMAEKETGGRKLRRKAEQLLFLTGKYLNRKEIYKGGH